MYKYANMYRVDKQKELFRCEMILRKRLNRELYRKERKEQKSIKNVESGEKFH